MARVGRTFVRASSFENIIYTCNLAIIGHSGNDALVRNILAKEGNLTLQQSGKEDDIAIATASIIARAEFTRQIVELWQITGIDLPKGANTPTNGLFNLTTFSN